MPSIPDPISQSIRMGLQDLTHFKSHPRPWHLPFIFAIAISLPVFVGAWWQQLSVGLLTSLGAMVILNLPTQYGGLIYRLTAVAACGFCMMTCFAMGLLAHLLPVLM